MNELDWVKRAVDDIEMYSREELAELFFVTSANADYWRAKYELATDVGELEDEPESDCCKWCNGWKESAQYYEGLADELQDKLKRIRSEMQKNQSPFDACVSIEKILDE